MALSAQRGARQVRPTLHHPAAAGAAEGPPSPRIRTPDSRSSSCRCSGLCPSPLSSHLSPLTLAPTLTSPTLFTLHLHRSRPFAPRPSPPDPPSHGR
eukprot:6384822-Prymnesium_polylepis.1